MSNELNGVELGKVACPIHGGSDSLSLYEAVIDGEKIINAHCWSTCGHVTPEKLKEYEVTDGKAKVLVDFVTQSSGKVFVMTEEVIKRVDKIKDYPVLGWKERRIPKLVSEFYGVRTQVNDEGEVTHRYYPSTEAGETVGWHVRDDEVKQAKNRGEAVDRPPFYPIGKVKSDCELFGQSLFPKGGKYLVLASGEEDTQAIFTALNTERVGGKIQLKKYLTPVISTTTGEGSLKQIRNNYEFITSFDNVIIMYDSDKAGQEGANKVAKIMFAGQAKIGSYRRNDACAHSSLGEFNEIVNVFWKAEQYSPVDVLHMNQLWDDFENEDSNVKMPFPPAWHILNEKLDGGTERGEVTVIGSLTSIGKSSFINSIVYNLVENTPYKVGAMYLEGTKREVVRDLLSLDMGINLRKSEIKASVNMDDLKDRWIKSFVQRDNFIFVDHQGSMNNDIIFDKLNHLAKVEGCDCIILDPLQACVNSNDNGKIIDFMDTILKFAKETNVAVILVSHMKKPFGDDPHKVSEYDLMGSSSINQIAFNTILLSRDKLHYDPQVKNSTHVTLVKCRRTSETGDAGWLRYDSDTTHIFQTHNPYETLDELSDSNFIEDNVESKPEEFSSRPAMGDDWETIDT